MIYKAIHVYLGINLIRFCVSNARAYIQEFKHNLNLLVRIQEHYFAESTVSQPDGEVHMNCKIVRVRDYISAD